MDQRAGALFVSSSSKKLHELSVRAQARRIRMSPSFSVAGAGVSSFTLFFKSISKACGSRPGLLFGGGNRSANLTHGACLMWELAQVKGENGDTPIGTFFLLSLERRVFPGNVRV